jgi:hypothetical protein
MSKSELTRSVESGDRYGNDQTAAKRVRLLYRSLLAQYGAGQNRALAEASCLRVAELAVATEGLRAKLIAAAEPDGEMINSVTRLESTCRRAALDLAKLGAVEKAWSPDDLPMVTIAEDEDGEEDNQEG